MNPSKYLLTYDLRILYCPNMKLALSCKELNLDTLEFTYYEGDLNVLNACYVLEADDVESIVKNIINGEVGNELDIDEMNWLKAFDYQYNKDANLVRNDELTFNYLILKLKLLGFSEEESKNIVKAYFVYKKNNVKGLPDVEDFISALNRKIRNKRFWICKNLYDETDLEYEFIKTVLSYKNKLQYKFDFRAFKDEYLKVCEKSIVPKLYNYNKTPSYLVRKPLDISDQRPYLLYTYKTHIASLINYLIERYFQNLASDERFINILIDELSAVVKLYLSISETKEYNDYEN